MYLGLITDKWSRKIVGFHLGESLETGNVLKALAMALRGLKASERPIHHSDRGCQYASHAYVNHAGTNMYSAFLGSLVGFSPPIYSLNFGFGDWDFMGSVYKALAEDLGGHWDNTPFPFPSEPQFDHQNVIGITFSEDTLATMTNLFLSGYSGEGNPITSLDLHGATGIEDVECWRLLRNDLRGLQAPVNQFKPWVGCVSAGLGRLLSAALGAQTLPCSVRGSAQATVRR
jgi:hypothetical protein